MTKKQLQIALEEQKAIVKKLDDKIDEYLTQAGRSEQAFYHLRAEIVSIGFGLRTLGIEEVADGRTVNAFSCQAELATRVANDMFRGRGRTNWTT